MLKIIVGVDISKASFAAAYACDGCFRTKHVSNDETGFLVFDDWLSAFSSGDIHVCLESTGIYGDRFAKHCYAQGYQVSVLNPAQVNSFAKAQLSRNKTDKSEAKVIAQFGEAMSPRSWSPAPQDMLDFGALVSRLSDLKQMRQQE